MTGLQMSILESSAGALAMEFGRRKAQRGRPPMRAYRLIAVRFKDSAARGEIPIRPYGRLEARHGIAAPPVRAQQEIASMPEGGASPDWQSHNATFLPVTQFGCYFIARLFLRVPARRRIPMRLIPPKMLRDGTAPGSRSDRGAVRLNDSRIFKTAVSPLGAPRGSDASAAVVECNPTGAPHPHISKLACNFAASRLRVSPASCHR